MNMTKNAQRICTLTLISAVLQVAAIANADGPPAAKTPRPDIYDRQADGEKQIATALAEAKRDHKRVLLQFGANWCGWCHKLNDLFKTNNAIKETLLYEYVVVHIDVDKVDGQQHNSKVNEKYGNPMKLGLPALVVLDEDGKQVVTQETGSLEKGDVHDPVKVVGFLKEWQAKAPTADEVLGAALAKAKSESKAVFVDFSAPWCVWCRVLDEYLHRPEIATVFEAGIVPVKIDIDRFKGGKEMCAKMGGGSSGIPFFVMLDSAGSPLGTSIPPGGKNTGFPGTPEEIQYFLSLVKKASPKTTEAQLKVLEEGFAKKAPKTGH